MKRKLLIGLLSAAIVTSVGIYYLRPEGKLPPGARADKVLVLKSKRRLVLFENDKPLKTYRIALGPNPVGHKTQEGDGKTPEGRYIIDYRNPKSRYHLSLHISYPNSDDKDQARSRGVSPGGDIMIHGLPNGFGDTRIPGDWTLGCIAVTDDRKRLIYPCA